VTNSLERRTVRSTDGTEIAVYETGRGPALALVYGALAGHRYWERLVPFLEHDFRLHLIERRGHGESGNTAPYTVEREIEDVEAVLTTLGGEVHVFGHSSGALLAAAAAQRASNVERLVLYEPPFGAGDQRPGARDWSQSLETQVAAGEREEAVESFLRHGPRVPAAQIMELKTSRRWPDYLAMAHTLTHDARIASEYGRFEAITPSMPTLVIVGGASPAWMAGGGHGLASRLADGRLDVLEGHGHNAVFTGPELLADTIRRFLRA
jgi:pimeloyl-ACP methyl ester carboxylesterase